MNSVERAAAAFSVRLDGAVTLKQGRGTVVRVRLSSGSSDTAILKQYKLEHRHHFQRERAGLGLLSSLAALEGFVPRVLAHDEPTLALLLEDITEIGSYQEQIFVQDPNAGGLLESTARRLGELHGHARELVPQFLQQVPDPIAPGALLNEGAAGTLAFIQRALAPAVSAELSLGSGLQTELLSVAERVDELGILTTLTLGDMAPSNVLLAPHGPVFIDLEYCAVRHACYDAMFWHCICPFSNQLTNRMDASYRAGLSSAGVKVDEAQFLGAMQLFMTHRLFWTLSWNMESLLDRDRELVPGVSTRATLIQYLREFVRITAQIPAPEHPLLLQVAKRLEARLSSLWDAR
ncbi:MAG TPA: hypothetical protein VNW92_19600 [Polyangiaceae bacterium]|jgi:hypothetical protein|nr:hypothetical protein [Polyangiaceae bacterium]